MHLVRSLCIYSITNKIYISTQILSTSLTICNYYISESRQDVGKTHSFVSAEIQVRSPITLEVMGLNIGFQISIGVKSGSISA